MTWHLVKVVGNTLVNPDGTVRSLNPAVAPPWTDGGSYGPYTWTAMPPGTSGQYEQVALNGAAAVYNPTGHEPVVYPYQPAAPNTAGYGTLGAEPL